MTSELSPIARLAINFLAEVQQGREDEIRREFAEEQARDAALAEQATAQSMLIVEARALGCRLVELAGIQGPSEVSPSPRKGLANLFLRRSRPTPALLPRIETYTDGDKKITETPVLDHAEIEMIDDIAISLGWKYRVTDPPKDKWDRYDRSITILQTATDFDTGRHVSEPCYVVHPGQAPRDKKYWIRGPEFDAYVRQEQESFEQEHPDHEEEYSRWLIDQQTWWTHQMAHDKQARRYGYADFPDELFVLPLGLIRLANRALGTVLPVKC